MLCFACLTFEYSKEQQYAMTFNLNLGLWGYKWFLLLDFYFLILFKIKFPLSLPCWLVCCAEQIKSSLSLYVVYLLIVEIESGRRIRHI